MPKQLTLDDAKQSLTAHLAAKGAELREKYGPVIGWDELLRILDDRACVRYPCEIRFDATQLLAGEPAFPAPNGAQPEDGFTICVHPLYEADKSVVPALVLYQLVVVNYGGFAASSDAETFGSEALGMSREDYYQLLCAQADRLPTAEASAPGACGCSHT